MPRLRIVVGGYLGLLPAGGVAWDYVQYPLGFAPTSAIDPSLRMLAQEGRPALSEDGPCFYSARETARPADHRLLCAE